MYVYMPVCVQQPPLCMDSISTVSVTVSQPRSKFIKWKIPEIIHVLSCAPF